ncbi:hypothetical protein [Pedobacter deserti]|uniref:hypothetical protein n=1 Tax=Pedobacter deserti TaxID=2817382 RepID=UPI00210BFBC4|nr:hypothetical protein [Pedobacter sp. SYSU D00382]
MKIFNLILLGLMSLVVKPAAAQSFVYPTLPVKGKTITNLIPAQWKVVDSVRGDLNADGADDLALVLEFYAAVKENRAYGDSNMELITELQRPRILAIYFQKGRNFLLAGQNNDFLLRAQEGGSLGDPLRKLYIANNTLALNFEGGGNWRWTLQYVFGYRDKDWALVSARNYAYHSSSGEMQDKHYDFLTGTKTLSTGNVDSSVTPTLKKEIPLQPMALRNLQSFKKPWTWQIGPDEFL